MSRNIRVSEPSALRSAFGGGFFVCPGGTRCTGQVTREDTGHGTRDTGHGTRDTGHGRAGRATGRRGGGWSDSRTSGGEDRAADTTARHRTQETARQVPQPEVRDQAPDTTPGHRTRAPGSGLHRSAPNTAPRRPRPGQKSAPGSGISTRSPVEPLSTTAQQHRLRGSGAGVGRGAGRAMRVRTSTMRSCP